MARAYWDESNGQWVASFRGLGMVNKQRRRVRLDRSKFPADDRSAADSFAAECERYCRALEIAPQDPADIQHALRIKAIVEEQGNRLLDELPAGPAVQPRPSMTIREAAAAHPASVRDSRKRLYDHVLHLKHVDEFCEFAKVKKLSELTLAGAMAWLERLRSQGLTWDGRRHRLMYLRRAARMGTTVGFADQLAGLLIDRNEDEEWQVEYWTLPELAAALRKATDPRVRLAVALGGFLGLRPSEIARARIGDLVHGDVLRVGAREAKNRASRRALPLPPTIAKWWREYAADRKADEALIAPQSLATKTAVFDKTVFGQWLRPIVADLTGRELPVKCLRKSFATWAVREGMQGRHVEAFLGHQTALVSIVTTRHYLGEVMAAELRPAATMIEAALRRELTRAKTKRRATRVATASLSR